MFQDEARFGRMNEPKRCWAPPGIRPIVGHQLIREYTYAYAAVSPLDGLADFLILPYMNAKLMSLFLAEVAKRHPEEYIFMIIDGAPCHQETALVIPDNIRITTLPPYCPELNPTEHVWDEIREKFFPNVVFGSLEAVEDQLVEAIVFLEKNPTIVQSITGFKWIVNALMKN
jgi:transposase